MGCDDETQPKELPFVDCESSEHMASGDDTVTKACTTAGDTATTGATTPDHRSIPEKIMSWYADVLLRPKVKALVLVFFAIFFALCSWNVTFLEQEFNVSNYVSDDSYLKNLVYSLNHYTNVVQPIAIYFRNMDQASPEIQQQMINYIEDMEALPQMRLPGDQGDSSNITILGQILEGDADLTTLGNMTLRPFCWVRDFQDLERYYAKQPPEVVAALENLTFNEKLDFAFSDRMIREIYAPDIVRDEEGNIVASRCNLYIRNLDLREVLEQIGMLHDQRAVTEAQPINQLEENQKEWAMFAFDEMFLYWEAYAVSVQELIFTIVAGVVALSAIAFVFIPHWTGAVLVCPLIIILYINMMGSLEFLGLKINGLTYICVVVSIGLLIDFLLHILLRYYECSPGKTRNERVKETLETMGVSILIGGATTFLAVIPIAASSAEVFMTVFYAFFAMVALGCSHGLILLPVVLSLVGPTTNVRPIALKAESATEDGDIDTQKKCSPEDSLPSLQTMALSMSLSEANTNDLNSPTSGSSQQAIEDMSTGDESRYKDCFECSEAQYQEVTNESSGQ